MNWAWGQTYEGERYHVLKLLGVAALIVAAIVVAGVGIGLLQQSGTLKPVLSWPPKLVEELGLFGLVGTAFGAALIGFFIGLALFHGKPPSAAFTDGRPFDWDLMFSGAVLWIVLLIGLAAIDPSSRQGLTERLAQHDATAWALLVSVGLVVFFIQSGTEEVVFRGYLQPFLAAWFNNTTLALVLSTVIFTLLHLGDISVWGIGSVALLGLTLGVATIRAGTIAPAVGLHVSNNWLQVLASPSLSNASVTQQDFMHLVILCAVWLLWLIYETSESPDRG